MKNETLKWTLAILTLAMLVSVTSFPAEQALSEPLRAKLGARLALRVREFDARRAPLSLLTLWNRAPGGPGDWGMLGPCVGRVCVTRVAKTDLAELATEPELLLAEAPGHLFLRLDRSAEFMRLTKARAQFGLTGAGVLVAVIDTGLDWTHPDFIDVEGKTRVAWLLDLSRQPEGRFPELEQIGGGAVYRADDLQAVLDGQGGAAAGAALDPIGHGTHVAGIAVGDDPLYQGVAPRARLIVVKALTSELAEFDQDRVLAGLAFAQRVAAMENQPLVINLSLGSQMGAHDGTELLEIALDDMIQDASPPVAVTVAAGNDRNRGIHARGAVSGVRPLAFQILLPATDPPAPGRPASVAVDFWYDGPGAIDVVVVTPGGQRTDSVSPSGPTELDSWTSEGRVQLSCLPGPHPLNGLFRTVLTLEGNLAQPLSRGTWSVEFNGHSNRIDGWIGEFALGTSLFPRFLNHLDSGDLVGPPATARNVVAVGAIVSRASWIDADGEERFAEGTVGDLAAFSSPGPTRDGRLKPELVAPGAAVGAALSADADPRSPTSIFYSGGSRRLLLPDERHALSTGSSMASPQVAGLAALAFEAVPTMSGEKVRELLSITNTQDSFTGSGNLYQQAWGFGKADGLRLLSATLGNLGTTVDPNESLCGVAQPWLAPVPTFKLLAVVVPRDNQGLPLGANQRVEIRIDAGRFDAPVIDLGNGVYTRTLQGTGPRGTEARVSCRVNGVTLDAHPQVLFVPSQQERVGTGVVGGACGCGVDSRPDEVWWLTLLSAMLLLRVKRLRSFEPARPRLKRS